MRPRYDDLPDGLAWSVFGPGDAVGCLNLQTPERTAAAARLVVTGQVVSLNAPVDWPDPPLYSRRPVRHEVAVTPLGNHDDHLDSFYPQASSQWDGFGHVRDGRFGYYNGASRHELGIDAWARRGIVGRGVLLDVARHLDAQGRPLDWRQRDVVTVADLESCAAAQGVAVGEGDVLVVRTGWTAGYQRLDRAGRAALGGTRPTCPGLEASTAMAARLWDWGVSAVAADNPALEASPASSDWLHPHLLCRLGIPIGELWWLEELAEACAADGRYEFLLVAAPLHVTGGVGSSANALALR